jgi:hypothetical protein
MRPLVAHRRFGLGNVSWRTANSTGEAPTSPRSAMYRGMDMQFWQPGEAGSADGRRRDGYDLA